MFKMISAVYYKEMQLLKIVGNKESKKVAKGVVYVDGFEVGEFEMDCYVYSPQTHSGMLDANSCFTRVMEINDFSNIEVIFLDNCNNLLLRNTVNIDVCNKYPQEFQSTIGNKNGITINDGKENNFKRNVFDLGFKTPLTLLHIESSSKCNIRCKYCTLSDDYQSIERGLLRSEVMDKAIYGINDLQTVKNIQLSALGEPMLNPNIITLCKRIYQETYVRNVQFFTNGMLFSEEIADEIASIPLNFKITFSIDGNSSAENGRYRVGSEYDIIKKNIKYFLRKVVKKDNFWIRLHNLRVEGIDEGKDIKPPVFLLNDFGNLAIDSHRAFFFPDLSRDRLKKEGIGVYEYKNKKICKRTFSEATIRYNGDVIRCHWDSVCKIIMGNVLDRSLKEIWYGEEYINQRKMMLDSDFDTIPEVCKKCHAMNEGFLYKITAEEG